MLELPQVGFARSIAQHNSKLDVAVDWVEGCVAFTQSQVSAVEVVDILQENEIYNDQDFATEFVTDIWAELKRRADCMGAAAVYEVQARTISRRKEWRDEPAYCFCLLLALQAWYPGWASQFGPNYTKQGDLFEALTAASLVGFGWNVFRAGWRIGAPTRVREVIAGVCEHLGETEVPEAVDMWLEENSQDEGLDLLGWLPFRDGRGGRPVHLFQCASGGNWQEKLSTPDPETWRRVIGFTTIPQRGFALPFVLLRDEFRRKAGRINGVVVDRCRMLEVQEEEPNWVPGALKRRLVSWMRPRVKALPLVA